MKTITRLSLLALAFTLSVGSSIAQQSTHRTAAKAAARPASARPAVSQVKKTTPAPAVSSAASAAQAQTPAPVVARQTEPRTQPAAQPASTHTRPMAAARTRDAKNIYLNAGVGLATYYGGGLPLGVSAEVDVKNNFSVGGSFDYFRYNYGYYSGGYTFIYAGARASYHLSEALNVDNSNFDPYVGATLGFRHASYHDSYGYSYSDYGSGYNQWSVAGYTRWCPLSVHPQNWCLCRSRLWRIRPEARPDR